MNNTFRNTALKDVLATALAVALMAVLVPPSAHAREKKGQDSGQSDDAKKERFPQATRKAPEQTVSSSLSPTIEKLFKAYEQKDAAKAVPLADEVIANPKGNAYEHALAARIAAVTLLNTDNDKAKAYLEQAVAFDGLSNNEHYESMNLLAQMDLIDKQYDKSLAMIDRYLSETRTQDGDALVIKGNDLYRLKRYPRPSPRSRPLSTARRSRSRNG
ncbi:MAG: hypothetical protein U1F20_00125 [Lysobacterales bacterium]